MSRLRSLAVVSSLVMVGTVVPALAEKEPAAVYTVSVGGPCATPACLTGFEAVAIADLPAGGGAVPASCSFGSSPACLAGVQGDDSQLPAHGPGVSITTSQPTHVEISSCNNTPSCPGQTVLRLAVTVYGFPAPLEMGAACLVMAVRPMSSFCTDPQSFEPPA